MISRRCTYLLPDGHKCNKPLILFSTKDLITKRCPDHVGVTKSGETVLRNANTKQVNMRKMRIFVKERMVRQPYLDSDVENLKTDVDKLKIKLRNSNKVTMTKLRKAVKEQKDIILETTENPNIIRLEGLIIKLHNRIQQLEKLAEEE
jgi:hypothetical protein